MCEARPFSQPASSILHVSPASFHLDPNLPACFSLESVEWKPRCVIPQHSFLLRPWCGVRGCPNSSAPRPRCGVTTPAPIHCVILSKSFLLFGFVLLVKGRFWLR